MLSVLVLFILVASDDAVDSVTQCPEGCSCQVTSDNRQLTVGIHCSQSRPDVDEEQLYHQLDSMLSADQFVEHLTSLSITNTLLTRVPASVCKLLNLTSLNLDHNRLTELPDNCFTKLTKLVTLSAAGNAITRLHDGLFHGLQSLVNLQLPSNQIATIGLRLFSNFSDLTSLRLLDLSDNKLTSLEPWPYYRLILGSEISPVKINLAGNWILNFTNKLNFRFRCGMKRAWGILDLSHNVIEHIMDIFDGWNLGDPYLAIICMSPFTARSPGNGQVKLILAGNYFACDCIDLPFYKFVALFPRNNILNSVRCRADTFGKPMQAISLALNKFVCEQPNHCPSSCRCEYRPANVTLHVYCSAANLSSLPLDLPPLPKSYVKYKLDFSNNKLLRRLEYRQYFVNTSILDLSNCGLTEISMEPLKKVARFSLVNLKPGTGSRVIVMADWLAGGHTF